MNIKQIINYHRAAKALPHGLDRAREMLSIQRMAARSRSKLAPAIVYDAHLACSQALRNMPDADHGTRSELGRIKSESQYRINGLK